MLIFVITTLVLCVIALFVWNQAKVLSLVIKNADFKKLQKQYLVVYYLVTFGDWIQGPYLYKLYSDYGYNSDEIGVLYIVGILSSSVFGVAVGHFADRYGRKIACASYGVFYSLSCLAQTCSRYHVLLVGRVFGGLSTSILYTTFEAWYVNEHLNRYNLSPDWLNDTFGKSGSYTGPLAITAGLFSQFLVEILHFGPVAPFVVAIPFLLLSSCLVFFTWEEQRTSQVQEDKNKILSLSALNLICKEPLLLWLCLIQSLYESVVYIFIFSWTPVLTPLNPPLGLIFSVFMLAFTLGSNLYLFLISKELQPLNILSTTCLLALISFSVITVWISMNYYLKTNNLSVLGDKMLLYLCFFSFVFYEISIGLYYPAIGFLRGRIVPEQYRASVTNWFRFPMNIFTSFIILFKQSIGKMNTDLKSHDSEDYKFPVIFFGCVVMLFIATGLCILFAKSFLLKMSNANTDSVPEVRVASDEHVSRESTDNKSPTKND